MKKRLLVILAIAIVCVFAFAACAQTAATESASTSVEASSEAPAASESAAESQAQGGRTIGLILISGINSHCQELETAVRYGISLVILILNDNAFGFIKWKQKKCVLKISGLTMEILIFLSLPRVSGLQALKLKKAMILQRFWKKPLL